MAAVMVHRFVQFWHIISAFRTSVARLAWVSSFFLFFSFCLQIFVFWSSDSLFSFGLCFHCIPWSVLQRQYSSCVSDLSRGYLPLFPPDSLLVIFIIPPYSYLDVIYFILFIFVICYFPHFSFFFVLTVLRLLSFFLTSDIPLFLDSSLDTWCICVHLIALICYNLLRSPHQFSTPIFHTYFLHLCLAINPLSFTLPLFVTIIFIMIFVIRGYYMSFTLFYFSMLLFQNPFIGNYIFSPFWPFCFPWFVYLQPFIFPFLAAVVTYLSSLFISFITPWFHYPLVLRIFPAICSLFIFFFLTRNFQEMVHHLSFSLSPPFLVIVSD